MDFETGAALSGARFTFLRGDIARLHRALAQFMLDRQTRENGYTECNPPVLVNDGAMYGTDKLPKFAGDSFRTTDDRWIVPTSEVPLTATVADTILGDHDTDQIIRLIEMKESARRLHNEPRRVSSKPIRPLDPSCLRII